jgi:hypothetical protein
MTEAQRGADCSTLDESDIPSVRRSVRCNQNLRRSYHGKEKVYGSIP